MRHHDGVTGRYGGLGRERVILIIKNAITGMAMALTMDVYEQRCISD